jgi:hypothetical protein
MTARRWGWRRWLPALVVVSSFSAMFVRIAEGVAS